MRDAARTVRIAAAQTPEFREDVAASLVHLAQAAEAARDGGAALLCTPEGFLQGYLTDEAAARRAAVNLASPEFAGLLQQLPEGAPMMVVGLIEAEGGELYNTAAVIGGRAVVGRYRKRRLLKSELCFTPGEDCPVFEVEGLRFGINICFDSNFPEVAMAVALAGASLLVSPANNMLPRAAAEAWKDRHNAVRGERCREAGLWLISADVTGVRGDRVAWGPTAVLNPAGDVVAQLPLDAPGLLFFDLPVGEARGQPEAASAFS
ncbi:MAG TPA: carbon-nitrogen hydrolase family protein [Phenylobacterium sp.]|uniref:carbon-nitrogen hydrolase family protein n=1 Tax=Phenylobacterium sp. TaxID=1871053 RepID=UPI002F927308